MGYGRRIAILPVCVIAAMANISTFAAAPPDQSVTLGWTGTPLLIIGGYRLYYGGASRTYTNMVDAGSSTSATVTGLTAGATYFFAVTAYDLLGLESVFSGEISYTFPGMAKLTVANVSGQLWLTGQGPAGYTYDVLTSTDLQNWTAIGSVTTDGTGSFQFNDPSAATNALGYYRLRQSSTQRTSQTTLQH